MRLLVVGSGGREHALVWKLSQSALIDEIYAAPGNGGTDLLAKNIDIAPTDISGLANLAESERIDLTVVGPEIPLVQGIADEFSRRGLPCFGPTREAARLEGSKVYAKRLMKKYGIPTPAFEVFEDREKAIDYIRGAGTPIVIQTSGLASGKGSIIARDIEKAIEIVDSMLVKRVFGQAGSEIVVEEYLEGEEVSIIVLTDGKEMIPLLPSQDHKPVFDCNEGPNTGGMGAYAPVPRVGEKLLSEIEDRILDPVVEALGREGTVYKGVIYAGLMLTEDGPQVLEFNCRFGDPETQPVVPLLKSDLAGLIQATVEGRLGELKIEWSDKYAACVVLTSGGYPGSYEKGKKIDGLERAGSMDDVVIFHAGTKSVEGNFFTSGGRVLGVTGIGETLDGAIQKTYEAARLIHFENMHYRKDIGNRGRCLTF